MATINKLNKHSLTNGQHFTFLQRFILVLATAKLAGAKVATLLAQLTDGFQKEDDLLKQAQDSLLTAKIKDADTVRDNDYQTIKDIAHAWARLDIEGPKEAADAILRLLKIYKLNKNAQLDEESGVMSNLLQELTDAYKPYAAYIQTLGLTSVVRQMMKKNEEVIQLLGERDVEWSAKVVGVLRQQRLDNDALYDQLVQVLESHALIDAEPEPYQKLIAEWNGTVDRYKKMLDRKSQKNTPEEDDAAPDTTPDDKGGDDPTPTPTPDDEEKK